MPPRSLGYRSESEGEEEIEDIDDRDDSDFEELDEIEEVVKPRRRTAAAKPISARSTRASSVRSGRTSSAAGPSTAPTKPRKSRLVVEIPYMPFSNLKQYSYAPGLKAPTTVTRSRTLAAQDGWREDATPKPPAGKGKGRPTRSSARTSTRSTPHGFGGYGDDEEEYSTGPSETDYDSDDSLLTRRLRPRVFEPRQTRAQRKEHGTPPSEQPRYTRQQASTQQAHWQTQPTSPQGSEYEPQSEGESEIDEVDMDELDSEPESRGAYSDDEDVLTRHRPFCEKCRLGPADELLAKALKTKKKGRKRKYDVIDEPIDPVEHAESLEGWIECVRCCVASHWKCLSPAQQKKVLAEIAARSPDEAGRRSIGIDEAATFTCSRCEAYPVCFVCQKSHIKVSRPATPESVDGESAQDTAKKPSQPGAEGEPIDVDDDEGGLIKSAPAPLLFRCDRCKQAVHYEHLLDPFPPGKKYTTSEIATHYQKPDQDGTNAWYAQCCREWKWLVDRVIAWRPLPADAEEPPRKPGELPNYKDRLPREYLVKWKDRGFRHLSWVPHAWLLGINGHKLRHFIQKGPQLDLVTNETLAAKGDEMSAPTIRDVMDAEPKERHRELDDLEKKWEGHGPPPDVDAESSIPVDWSTIDRILEVHLLPPKKSRKAKRRIEDSDDEEDPSEVLQDGIAPPTSLAMPIRNWELRAERQLTADDVDEVAPLVTWALIKWQNLQYDEACYDTPPSKDSPLYRAYRKALQRYLAGRQVKIPILSQTAARKRDEEARLMKDPPEGQPDCVRGGKLMPFQIEGLQWLIYKYYHRQSCILADDMGLGKTIQVASFLGYLHSQEIYPSLVIVPNSTIANWVREIEKWVPDVRVVPYYGEALSRKLIATHELYHPGKVNQADGLKAHVILTTYETFINNHAMSKNVPRWESVIVDEGQRAKSDASLIFARLKQLRSVFRVLLTGTPLNNNLRELFNLLNYLDPEQFRALKELEARFENLNEGLLTELHELISPYILRRIKRDVLKLPPKVEIIVPIAMTPVQKQVTREILLRNVETIEGIVNKRKRKAKAKAKAKDVEKEIEVVDITDETPAPNGESAEKRQKTATPEGGPSGTPGEEPVQPEASAADAGNAEAAPEAMDVDGDDNGAVLVEDSQPASPPPTQANGDSAENNSESTQPKKLRGGFSVKGAAAAAARKRWDQHRRQKEQAALKAIVPAPPSVSLSDNDTANSEDGTVLDFEDVESSESASSDEAVSRGHGGFSKPGAAVAAANARWAKVRQQRAEQAERGKSPGLLSSDESSSEEETSPLPPRRRPPPVLVTAANVVTRPPRRGGFNVKGAAARAANLRWAKVREERQRVLGTNTDDARNSAARDTSQVNGTHSPATEPAARSQSNGTHEPSQNGTSNGHSESPRRENGSGTPSATSERNGSAAPEAPASQASQASQSSQATPRSSQKLKKKFKLQL